MARKNFTPLNPSLVKKPRNGSLPHKEAEPLLKHASYEMHEVGEHKLDEEVIPYIKVRKEKVDLPQDIKDMGVVETGNITFPSYNSVKTPLTDERIEQGLQQPVTSSFRWLAEFCLYLLKQAHVSLKIVKGKLIRVGVTAH